MIPQAIEILLDGHVEWNDVKDVGAVTLQFRSLVTAPAGTDHAVSGLYKCDRNRLANAGSSTSNKDRLWLKQNALVLYRLQSDLLCAAEG